MKRARKQGGFTIVETMVVLAVTGALFLMAVLAVGGEQDRTEFQQSINDIQSNVQQTIDQVGSGDYPNTDNFTCNGTAGTLKIQGGTNQQGSNTGCIFVGKVLQFDVHGTDPQQLVAYTIAGLQDNNGSLTQADPTAIAPGVNTNNVAGYPNASATSTLHDGLTVVKMTSGSISSGTQIGAVAFLSTLGTYSGSTLLSGTQQIDVYPVTGSTLNATTGSTVDAINNNLAGSPKDPSGGVQICFASGGTNQSGLITIGGSSGGLSVTLQIKSNRTCT